MKKVPLAIPHMGGHEMKYIQEAFSTNWIAPVGPNINKFEQKVCEYTGANDSVATSSGTAAIHLALNLMGVQAGDRVFCSTFTFVASANPIRYQQAIPVFIDSELETWNMSPVALEKALLQAKQHNELPKAIIIVHIYGQPAKMTEILALAKDYQIPVIEDAAESLGATYKGAQTGTLGDLGIYSFNGNKIITTSGGGMLVAKKTDLISAAKFLAEQAKEDAPYYQHEKIGYNYRLSNVSAGIGCGQMEVLTQRITQKRTIYERYNQALTKELPVKFQTESAQTFSNRWLTAMQFTGITPIKFKKRLAQKGIESRLLWKPLHLQPLFKDAVFVSEHPYGRMSNAEYLFSTGLCLPSATQMTESEQQYVIDNCLEIFEQLKDDK